MMFLIFFSVEKLGSDGKDGSDGLGNLLRSGVKRFTVAQALRQRTAVSKDSVGLRRLGMGVRKKARMMNALG